MTRLKLKRWGFYLLALLILKLGIMIASKHKMIAAQHLKSQNKIAFFTGKSTLLVVTPSKVYTYLFKESRPTATLYRADAENAIDLSYHTKALIKWENPYLTFTEKNELDTSSKTYNLAVFNTETSSKHQITLDFKPEAVFIQDDFLLVLSSKATFALYNLTSLELINEMALNLPFKFNFKSALLDVGDDSLFIYNDYGLAQYNYLTDQIDYLTTFKKRQKSTVLFFNAETDSLLYGNDQSLQLLNDDGQSFSLPFDISHKHHYQVALASSSKLLAFAQHNTLQLYSIDDDKIVWTKPLRTGLFGPMSFSFSDDDKLLLVGGSQIGQVGAFFVYNTETGRLINRMLGVNDS